MIFVIATCVSVLMGWMTLGQPASAAIAPPTQLRLTFWHGVNPPANREVLQTLVNDFNQTHPDIQVDALYVGQPDQQQPKILAAVVGDAPPDLLWFNPTLTGQLVELDAIRPLTDWFEASPLKSQLDPALWPTMSYEGQIWSIPFGTNNTGVFYRPSLFQAAGVQQPPTTWLEFRQVARQLTRDTNGDGHINQHGIQLALGKGDFTVFTWLSFLWSGGAEIEAQVTDGGSRRVLINQPGAVAALNLWQQMVADGSARLSLPERGYELEAFMAGKVAMQISGPWTIRQLQQAQVDFDVFPMPTAVTAATALGGENLFVFKTNAVREAAALEFAAYVASESFQTRWALGTGYLPTNLAARTSPAYQAFVHDYPVLQIFLDQMAIARSRPLFPSYARVTENLGRALEATLLQKQTPELALKAAQQRLDLIFKSVIVR